MRPFVLSIGACILALGAAWAQNTGGGGRGAPQLPVGQTFKQFEFPDYQGGVLKFTLDAAEATGMTPNRAETTDLKIKIYDNGAVTTTVTSPKADLYVGDQRMRTKNTVLIDRDDMTATAQACDFDLVHKTYLLRTNVRVLLKHFDISATPASGGSSPSAPSVTPAPVPLAPTTPHRNDSLLDSPGAYAGSNAAPARPSEPNAK